MTPAEVDVHALRGAAPAPPLPDSRPRRRRGKAPRELGVARRPWMRPDALAVLALGAFCALLLALTWGTWGDLAMDTGYDLLAGARTADGEIPYADYVYFYGPVAPYLLGGVYLVFGTGIAPAVGLGLVLALAIVAATYVFGRSLTGVAGGLFAGALTATAALSNANNSFAMPHTLSAPLAVLLCLGALLAAGAVARGGGRGWLAAAGALAGLVALARPEYTLAIFVTLTAWLGLRAIAARDRRRAAGDALVAALPALAIPLMAYGLLLTQLSLGDLVTKNLYPVEYLREAGSVVLKAHAPLTAGSFAELAGRLALYAAGAGALVASALAVARGGRWRMAAMALTGAGALAFVGLLAIRPETVRYYLEFAYGWIPAGAWLAVALLVWRFRRRRGPVWARDAQVELLAVLFLAAIATKSYASFFPQPNPEFPPDTPYMLPFAGAFLAWLHLRELPRALPRGGAAVRSFGAGWLALLVLASAVLVVGDARKETVTVAGAHGQLTALPADGPAYQAALDTIERETSSGEPILLAPQMSSLYVISGRENPLPELSLLPGTLDAAGERRAIDALQSKGVRLAITDRAPLTTYDHGAFGESYARRLASWLRSEFRRTAVLRGTGLDPRVLDVWQRRTP